MTSLSYEEVLKEKEFFIINIKGTSMLPLLDEKKDTVKIVRFNQLHKYDVVLYKRSDGTYVLHRIIKIKKDYYLITGDNQAILEIVYPKQIIGLMDGYFKDEEYIASDNKEYLKYVKKRMRTRFFRLIRYRLSQIYHKIFKKKNSN